MLNWSVKVPDYTVINRRKKKLKIEGSEQIEKKGMKLYIVIDSTGLKVYGEGEWKVRQQGWGKHRTWMKLHVAVDESTAIIESCAITSNSVDAAAMVKPLLDKVKTEVKKMAGDGACDKIKVYEYLEEGKIQPIIPPRKGARDKNIRDIGKRGRIRWKEKNNYHRRSKAETTMYGWKIIYGDKLRSRITEQQIVEANIKCKLLNKMTLLGMPKSSVVKKAT